MLEAGLDSPLHVLSYMWQLFLPRLPGIGNGIELQPYAPTRPSNHSSRAVSTPGK
jgi:hypothetical protein